MPLAVALFIEYVICAVNYFICSIYFNLFTLPILCNLYSKKKKMVCQAMIRGLFFLSSSSLNTHWLVATMIHDSQGE